MRRRYNLRPNEEQIMQRLVDIFKLHDACIYRLYLPIASALQRLSERTSVDRNRMVDCRIKLTANFPARSRIRVTLARFDDKENKQTRETNYSQWHQKQLMQQFCLVHYKPESTSLTALTAGFIFAKFYPGFTMFPLIFRTVGNQFNYDVISFGQ
jgi:hypothetical protein